MDEEAIFPMGLGPAVALARTAELERVELGPAEQEPAAELGQTELGPAEQEPAAELGQTDLELGPAEQEPAAELGRVELGPVEQEPAAELGQAGPEQGPGPVLENREGPPHPSHRYPGRQQTNLPLLLP